MSKVHFIRFRDTNYPPALNLLHRFPDEAGDEVQAVVESIMEIIKTVIPGQAPQNRKVARKHNRNIVIRYFTHTHDFECPTVYYR